MSEPHRDIERKRNHEIKLSPNDPEWIDIVNYNFNQLELELGQTIKIFEELKQTFNGQIQISKEP